MCVNHPSRVFPVLSFSLLHPLHHSIDQADAYVIYASSLLYRSSLAITAANQLVRLELSCCPRSNKSTSQYLNPLRLSVMYECKTRMDLYANYPSCVSRLCLFRFPLSLHALDRTGPRALHQRYISSLLFFAMRSTLRTDSRV